MAFQDLREFIAFLEKKGQLQRIKTPVKCELEITEMTDRVSQAGGPALLFENVTGYNIPVLINTFGSEKRMSWALGVNNLDELGEGLKKWIDMVQNRPPEGLMDKIKLLPELAEFARIGPRTVSHSSCQEVVLTENFNVNMFPILKCWPDDGGRFITLTMCHSKDPLTGKRNIGMYRVQIYDEKTVGMHWQIHKGGAAHFRDAARQHRRMEVAVVIGAEPASVYAASAPLPPGIDELLFAGFLRHKPVEVVQCKTVDVQLLKVVLPEVVDMNMPIEGGFHNVVIVSIKKRYPGQAKKVMCAIWGMMLLMLSKFIIVVDEDVNVQNLHEVLFRVGNNVDPKRDTLLVDGPVDALDHSSPFEKFGWKMGFDATAKMPEEGHPRPWPPDIVMAPEVVDMVTKRWKEYGINL